MFATVNGAAILFSSVLIMCLMSCCLSCAAIASAEDISSFAVLALLPESSKCNETSFKGRDGVILLFNAADPVPVSTWSVNKVR